MITCVILMLSPAGFSPAALGEPGLSLIVFATPPGLGIGGRVNVDVEAYSWGAPVDLDILEITVGPPGSRTELVALTNVSKGVWGGEFTVNASAYTYILIEARGMRGSAVVVQSLRYELSESAAFWTVRARLVAPEGPRVSLGPGSTVWIETRTYSRGSLRDPPPTLEAVRVSVSYLTTIAPVTEELPAMRTAEGVVRFPFTIDVNLREPRVFTVNVHPGYPSSGLEFGFYVNPLPLVAWIESINETSATVKTLTSPLSDAAQGWIGVRGHAYDMRSGRFAEISAENTTPDVNGLATLRVGWPVGYPSLWLTVVANISRREGVVELKANVPLAPGHWAPGGNDPSPCAAAELVNTLQYGAGATAGLAFRVTEAGEPVSLANLTVVLYRSSTPGASTTRNVSTDENGDFRLDWVVPSDWSSNEYLGLSVACPNNAPGQVAILFREARVRSDSIQVNWSSSADHRRLAISVNYTGVRSLENTSATALLLPTGPGGAPVAVAGGDFPSALLAPNGRTFEGELQVPPSWPAGDYRLMVTLTNEGAAAELESEWRGANEVTVPLGAYEPQPEHSGLADSLWALVLATTAAVAVVYAIHTRRRIGDRP